MWHRIVHPELFTGDYASLSDFFASTCTIQRAAIAYDTFGAEVFTWGDLAGHVDLACTIAPVDSSAKEVKAADQTYVVASHHVTLGSYHPDIGEKDRAVVTNTASDTLTLDILLVETDSQSDSTRLYCQLVE